MIAKRCLKVDAPYAMDEVLGFKVWEIKRRPTKIRERIGIVCMKHKRVLGYVDLVDCIEMPVEELKKHGDKHKATDFLDKYANGRKTLYAWVFANPQLEFFNKPYTFSTGCWCFLKEANA